MKNKEGTKIKLLIYSISNNIYFMTYYDDGSLIVYNSVPPLINDLLSDSYSNIEMICDIYTMKNIHINGLIVYIYDTLKVKSDNILLYSSEIDLPTLINSTYQYLFKKIDINLLAIDELRANITLQVLGLIKKYKPAISMMCVNNILTLTQYDSISSLKLPYKYNMNISDDDLDAFFKYKNMYTNGMILITNVDDDIIKDKLYQYMSSHIDSLDIIYDNSFSNKLIKSWQILLNEEVSVEHIAI